MMPVPRSVIELVGPLPEEEVASGTMAMCGRKHEGKTGTSAAFIVYTLAQALSLHGRRQLGLCCNGHTGFIKETDSGVEYGANVYSCPRTGKRSCKQCAKCWRKVNVRKTREGAMRWKKNNPDGVAKQLLDGRLKSLLDGGVPRHLAFGAMNPNWRGGSLRGCSLLSCCNQLQVNPWRLKNNVSGRFYCSRECQKRHRRGEY